MTDWIQLLARVLIAQIFLGAGISKLLNTAQITQQIATRVSGPLVPLFLIGAIAIELIGGASLMLGFRLQWVAPILAVYVLIATAMYHADFSKPFQADLFSKDMAIIGGLLLIAALGSGRFSLEALLVR
jgi:putative oxidoreductase